MRITKLALVHWSTVASTVCAFVVAAGAQATAPTGPQGASTSGPGSAAPTTETTSRSELTFRPSPNPVPPRSLRGSRSAAAPLLWGWGGVPYAVGAMSPPLDEGPAGGLQLDVQPWRASVYADGKYAGRVEDFSGYYRHLELTAGHHEIVVVEPGYEPLVFETLVVPGRTSTYRGTLQH